MCIRDRVTAGEATQAEIDATIDAIKTDPSLRADLIAKTREAMKEMNAHNWGNEKNRAVEMKFLIDALKRL